MWIPQTWKDIELAIGTLSENEALDFKRDLAPGKKLNDIAKDAAAMSLQGGVILIGVDEHNNLATSITPVPLAGAVERIRQVLDTRVSPGLGVEIQKLTKDTGDKDGVIALTVPPSWSSPHQFDHRFPARSGSTTRWLSESELEGLFARRTSLQREGATENGMAGHEVPPGVRLEHLDHVGVMRLRIRPLVSVQHPEEPRLRRSLTQACFDTTQTLDAPLGRFTPKTWDFLERWGPAGSLGWQAGRFTASAEQIQGSGIVGAVYRYGHGFSFTTQISLLSGMEPDAPAGATMAEEHHWAIEGMAQLALGAAFHREISEASLLRVDLELGGLLGAVSYQAARGLAFETGAPTVTENLYSVGDVFSTAELASDPREATRRLLDPLMVAILDEGLDIFEWIATA